MSQMQRKTFHFILYLLLERIEMPEAKRGTKQWVGFVLFKLNDQYEIKYSAHLRRTILLIYFPVTPVKEEIAVHHCDSRIYKYCQRQTFVCES
jgi:hypothetical protein